MTNFDVVTHMAEGHVSRVSHIPSQGNVGPSASSFGGVLHVLHVLSPHV